MNSNRRTLFPEMMNPNQPDTSLPRGVADYLPGRAAALSMLEQRVLQVADVWGFQRIITPPLEFEDVLASGLGEGLRARSFRFDDWQSGRMLAIPPDITPQIARIVATRLKGWPLPHRISYAGRVLRHSELQSGRGREIMQAGVELIGLESPEADAEMVAMAVEVMQSVGLSDFKVDLGQAAFCRGVFEASNLSGEALRMLREAVARKDTAQVADVVQGYPVSEQSRKEIMALTRLFGGKDVLREAGQVTANKLSRQALENLGQVIDILDMHGISDQITIDLGETRGLDYHTGLTFEGFMPGIGDALFSGGRYDDLTARFGYPAPATGFTFNLFSLLQALEATKAMQDPLRDILLFNAREDRQEVLELARLLRKKGYSVARDIIRRDLGASIDYASQSGIRWIVVLRDDTTLLLVNSTNRTESVVSLDELCNILEKQS